MLSMVVTLGKLMTFLVPSPSKLSLCACASVWITTQGWCRGFGGSPNSKLKVCHCLADSVSRFTCLIQTANICIPSEQLMAPK